ncbi:MAG: hypothetical protein ABIJ72_04190 [bacterium]
MKNYLYKKLSADYLASFSVLVILLYIFFWLLKFTPGMAFFGFILLFFLPGKFLIELFPKLTLQTGKIGKFSFASIYSLALISIIGFIAQNKFGFAMNEQVVVIILVNAVLLLCYFFLIRLKIWKGFILKSKIQYQIGWKDYLTLTLLAGAILVTILMNPVAQNYDNYLVLLKLSDFHSANLTGMRQIFISLLELTGKVTNINAAFIYRNLLNALFFISTLTFYDYLKRYIAQSKIVFLTYLFFLAPPVILVQINQTMPQIILLIFTTPVLILLIESLRTKKITVAITAFIVSFVSLAFHQLSAVLILVSTITLLAHLGRLIFTEKKISIKHILLFLLIVIPWIKILNLWYIFIPPIFIFRFALDNFKSITWHWWFLDSYIDIDSQSVSFSGINAVLYYLYNGILPLLLLAYLIVVTSIKRFRPGIYTIPAFLYLVFFFLVAEIFPRIGLIMLPSRAWLHMMIPTVILLAVYGEILVRNKLALKPHLIVLLVLIVIGYAGIIFVTANNIKKVYRGQLPVAVYMKKNLAKDALVISSQDNNVIVNIYADRYYFGRIVTDHKIDKNEFEQLIQDELEVLQENKNDVIQDKLNRYLDTPDFNHNEIYFLYCNSQLGASNHANANRQGFNDALNRDTYANLGYLVAYADKECLLIKIR